MIDGIIVLLTVLIAYKYLNTVGRTSVYTFSIAVLTFNSIGFYIPNEYGTYYYLFAALTDLFIIFQLSKIKHPTKTTIIIQKGCFAFILNNFIGWVVFMQYYPPLVYAILSTIIYATILTLIISGLKNGSANMDRYRVGFFGFNAKSCHFMPSYKKEARF